MSEIQKLSVAERIKLVEDLWDTIAIDTNKIPVTELQRKELDRRLERYMAEGGDSIPAGDAVAEIRKRL